LLRLKETLPIPACTIPVLSTLKSILPAFTSEQLFATSIVTVPVLGLGKPLGPKYDLMDPFTHNAWHSDDYINICPTRFNFAK
jgi:hypothetical protein